VQIWVAASPAADVPPPALANLATALARRADATRAAVWSTQADAAPEALQSIISARLATLTVAEITERDAQALNHDKLLLVAVERRDGWFDVHVRELDCRSQQWSHV